MTIGLHPTSVFVALGDDGFGRRFGWVEDRFGVSRLLTID